MFIIVMIKYASLLKKEDIIIGSNKVWLLVMVHEESFWHGYYY